MNHLANNDKLSVSIIKELHADLIDRLQYDTTLQVIKNYVFLQPIVHKPLG